MFSMLRGLLGLVSWCAVWAACVGCSTDDGDDAPVCVIDGDCADGLQCHAQSVCASETARVISLFRSAQGMTTELVVEPPPNANVYWYVDFDFDSPRQFEFGPSLQLSPCDSSLSAMPDRSTVRIEALVTTGEVLFSVDAPAGTDPRVTSGEMLAELAWTAEIDGSFTDCQ